MTAERSTPHPFSLSVERQHQAAEVVLAGELDLSSVDLLSDAVDELRAAGFEHVVIDLRRLSFIDSSGLRVLLMLRNAARRAEQRLELVEGPREVQRIFELTATRPLFDWRGE